MEITADLHIHSKYSRACSSSLTIPNLEKWARIKGVNLLGTGDFQHQKWFNELKENLTEEDGILKTKTGFNFLLQTEISLIYNQDGKTRKIHHVILAPSYDVASQIIEILSKKGRLDYDGRPIFGMSSIELVEKMMEVSKEIEIIPGHCLTPWFSIFGSNSGFDSVEECFKEKTRYIHALETGMSADPAMIWRVDEWSKFNLVSNSDSHSFWPWRIGREANIFECGLNYKEIVNAIRTKKGFVETIEVEPGYGKYHIDGHRNCNVFMEPCEAKKYNNICPVCKDKLTIGVLHRVEDLANRDIGYKPKDAVGFRKLIPLTEVIAGVYGIKQLASKKVWGIYNGLIKNFGNEFNVLLNVEMNDLKKFVDEKLAKVILLNREEKLKISPGYDGVYGKPIIDKEYLMKEQKSLSDF
ncbi:DNA helicase UvrD [Candidatus Woesearchaeota archaeon]|nr:DNA helicase UvrD [Candidatus Woesearchaeota archaeon]